ncbi:hypothetical protein [Aequorivita echinoideorum]|uniref:Uncharacterized protein n=1 Tax=Aequorivita echinoideorum TaxID=1549647 RepID=A0ABS5S400_9FLAO|nr:hypothetical protein [Aequorivita echinoideorum]MBT0607939.1 hypothetical protein [Aequorivita echinoideorum]
MGRLCVYAKDLAVILGKTPETCNKKLREIRKKLGKKKDSPITIPEVAEYLEIDVALIREVIFMRDNPRANVSK